MLASECTIYFLVYQELKPKDEQSRVYSEGSYPINQRVKLALIEEHIYMANTIYTTTKSLGREEKGDAGGMVKLKLSLFADVALQDHIRFGASLTTQTTRNVDEFGSRWDRNFRARAAGNIRRIKLNVSTTGTCNINKCSLL